MDKSKLNILFFLFCFLTIVFACVEVFLVYKLVTSTFEWGKGIASILTTGLLAGCGTIFLNIIRKSFVDRETLSMGQLHSFLSSRRKIIESAREKQEESQRTQRELITRTLEFGEATLNSWISGSHFELSVFSDASSPIMLAYFDSKHEASARSMAKRQTNPSYYVDNKYEVCKVLSSPSSEPRIISDTHTANYSFISDQQKRQVKSSVLVTIDMNIPCVLVVASNARNAFDENDSELMSFLRVLAEQIRIDLCGNGRVSSPETDSNSTKAIEDMSVHDFSSDPRREGKQATLPKLP